MPPRIRLCPQCLRPFRLSPRFSRQYASPAAITPAASLDQITISPPPLTRFPLTQPPSHKPPEYRKSQLHRQYTSLLRSSPLILLFQHSNLTAQEWMAIRRELSAALRRIDEQQQEQGQFQSPPQADAAKLQIIQTSLFRSALLVAEHFHPATSPKPPIPHATDPSTQSSAELPNQSPSPRETTYTHGLSKTAHAAVRRYKPTHPLTPLLSGPLAALSFPSVSPAHLAAALSILAPNPKFPAPKRRVNPAYHDPGVQAGLQKLMLLCARVENRVFDGEGVRWVGGLEGGMTGLRAQLVGALGTVGATVTGALEGMGRNLYFTVEGRRGMLEEEAKSSEGGGAS